MTNFVFFGTDEFAVKVLEQLKADNLLPTLIITTPDSKKGRHLALTPSPIKVWAQKYRVPSTEYRANLELGTRNWELFLVASYGKIIPKNILDLPKHGTLNIHPSLLPKYRGATPLQSAILNGDPETGVSIMLLDEELDHGPILATDHLKLATDNFNYSQLRDKSAKMGAKLLVKILPDYLTGKIKPREQNHSVATYTQKITKDLSRLDLSADPIINDRKIRALNPNPGTYFVDDNGKRIKVISAHLTSVQLIFDRVIPEGKKEMTWESYLKGQTK
jgi:methionyl-tRNA formyltransferase